ncbi:TetR/AcrR family transcriptional regulator [Spongiactinospora rosea]|uniref:TetR/AcrR family transcriptional regulator n=1 Tax=Spongiactinospora rosea TaxID=2248750 RepID=A0A366LW68_9ACTN|nr:helix-turn-helix domain-containing protein [Spongiactinospora rosea]RBQ17830.1 TetR/AcrR family transcriptional regulator [Spongiactinospora rosea]
MTQDVTYHRRPLNRQLIVAAARRVADSDGLAELTLRRVAGELGTGQASLYRHIADRAELLGLLAEDLATSFPMPGRPDEPGEPGEPGESAEAGRNGWAGDAVVGQWEAMYAYLAAHPWGARVIAEGSRVADGAHSVAGHNLALLRAAGLDDDDAVRAYRALWHLLLGHLLDQTAHPATPGSPGDFSWALRRLVAGIVRATDAPAEVDS